MDHPEPEPQRKMPLDLDAIVGADPLQTLLDLVVELHSETDPNEDFVESMGIGPLESLLHRNLGDDLWPHIERLARTDPLFRRALSYCWAYDSPEFDRRVHLLEELGEIPGGPRD